jgi:hypothetical protein
MKKTLHQYDQRTVAQASATGRFATNRRLQSVSTIAVNFSALTRTHADTIERPIALHQK